ncbi:MAG TPA: hypothetical protein VMQ73_23690, partial [Methylomirabilota bacterium]|nr:hypothetical protein [Methylomirabilota bacterium]
MSVIFDPTYLEAAAVDLRVPTADRADDETASARPPRWVAPLRSAAVGLAFPAALLVLWTLSARDGWLPEQILPDPRVVLATLEEYAGSGELLDDTRISLVRVAE